MVSLVFLLCCRVDNTWNLQSWCIGCSPLYTDHTADDLNEVVDDTLQLWNLSPSAMASITTDNASNNQKAFRRFTWLPCFGHNLDLAVSKAGLKIVCS